MSNRKIIVILGPTASGKSSLGVRLAKRYNGVVLSADSRQIYKGLDAGSAKITVAEMKGVPHFLLDLASPKTIFTVAQYQQTAKKVLAKIPESTPIFIVGGSPFYIEAITSSTSFPSVPPNPLLRKKLERQTAIQLFEKLRRLDPRRAATIDQKNKVRLIRALEIINALGKVPERQATKRSTLTIGLGPSRKILYNNIDKRVDLRMPAIVKEIKKLRAQGLTWKRMDQLGLEYRWIGRLVRGVITYNEATERLKGDIHAFARRQLTWWRKDQSIHWIKKPAAADRLVRNYLRV